MIVWVLLGLGCYGLLEWMLWTCLKAASDSDDRLDAMFHEDTEEELDVNVVDSAAGESR